MTNEQIIFSKRIELMKAEIIGSTGKFLTFVDDTGNEISVEEPEEIHTYAGWIAQGRRVKKGENAIIVFPIWKKTTKKSEGKENPEDILIMTKAHWFKKSQTNPL